MAYNYELDKITYQELSISLQNDIKSNIAHRNNLTIHVTQKDKDTWNTVKDLPLVTTTVKGYMSPQDKVKLNGIENNANNYIHPKTGVRPGIYFQVEVNEYGHVVVGRNPSKLNTTADNADRLGNHTPDYYAKVVSENFLGQPTVETPDGSNPIQIVNVEYVKQYKPYIQQDTTPTEEYRPRFWIGPNNCLNAYNPKKGWNSVFAEVSLFSKALNEDIDKPTKPNDYSGFMKFIGKRKVSALNLKGIHSTKTEFATVFGMRYDSEGEAYEFICLDDNVYMRHGKDKTWGQVFAVSSNEPRENTVTYTSDNKVIAGDFEMWIGEE